jgi:hypothetical protein
VKWDTKTIDGIEIALKNSGFSTFDYTNYIKAPLKDDTDVYLSGLDVLYLNGDTSGMTKENKVNLTYQFRGVQGTCTCKWQGNSAVHFPKKNFTIAKLSPAIDVGWGAQKKYCLKADFVDFSHARNVVGAKIWGTIVKSRTNVDSRLAALPNGGAIDGFPIMLILNGEFYGLYNFNIPKDPWMLGMGSGNTEAMVTAENPAPTTGFKATVSKEDMLAKKYWELEYVPDEDNPDWAIDSFNRMLQACIDSTGTNYKDTLDTYLDIESAIDYYIFCHIIGDADGVQTNFIMATYDGIKWFFNAYDLDHTFGLTGYGTNYFSPTYQSFNGIQTLNRVFHLIYTYDKEALKNRYRELRNGSLSENNIANTMSRYIGQIPMMVMDEDAKIWPTLPGTLMNNYTQIVNWYRLRTAYTDAEIESL